MEVSATFIPKALSDETLAAPALPGKRLLEPLKSFSLQSGVPLHILEDVGVENPPEIHMREADLWIGLSGEVHFVVGGTIADAQAQVRADGTANHDELTGMQLVGGVSYIVRPGDILHIPAGVPHSHSAAGPARLYIIKIPLVS